MELLALILGLFATGAALIQIEFGLHSRSKPERRHGWLKFAVYVLFVGVLMLVRLWGYWAAAGLLCLAALFALGELRKLLSQAPAQAVLVAVAVAFGLSHLLQPTGNGGFAIWAAAILLVSTTDAFAQLLGKLLGRHQLCPQLSPGKTVEGLIGGILCTAALAVAIGFLLPEVPWPKRLLLGIVTAAAAVTGDLLFSAIKRRAGVKDFSNLIPAHGGVLDRIDSLVLGAPAFYWTLQALTV